MRIEDLEYGDKIEVEWIDADQGAEWTTLGDILGEEPDLECRTVGYFLYATDRLIVGSTTIGIQDDTALNGVFHIPRCWFQKCRRL